MSAHRKVTAAPSLLPAGHLGARLRADDTQVRIKAGSGGRYRDLAAMDTIDPNAVTGFHNRWKP